MESQHLKAKAGETKALDVYTFDALSYEWIKRTNNAAEQHHGNINVDESKEQNNHEFRMATFNILFDNYTPHLLHNHIRYQKQFEEFEKLNFDILVLNEVTQTYLTRLVLNDFICENYNISEIAPLPYGQYSSLVPYGSLLLSKYPIESVVEYTFKGGYDPENMTIQKNKSCLFATVLVPNPHEQTPWIRLGLCCVHLKAGKGFEEQEMRRLELIEIEQYYQQHKSDFDEFFILGDFNFQSTDEESLINRNEFVDLWPTIRGKNDPGYTCDNSINTLMLVMRPPMPADEHPWKRRLDRILMSKHGKGCFAPHSIDLFANKPIFESTKQEKGNGNGGNKVDYSKPMPKENYLFLSDHFGVACTMKYIA